MSRIKSLVNHRYNKLLVLSFSHSNKNQHAVWNCICDCGNETQATTNALNSQHKRSCGCLHKDVMVKKRKFDTYINRLYRNCKNSATLRGYEFEISVQQYEALIKKDCFYCGDKPTRPRFADRLSTKKYPCHGVDRKNNEVGYVVENCVTCCEQCNTIKMDMSYTDFVSKISKIYNKHIW